MATSKEDKEKSVDNLGGTSMDFTTDPTKYRVDFEGSQDLTNPQNWTMRRKILTVTFFVWSTLASTFASADLSPAAQEIEKRFNVSREVATLATSSLFLGGYSIGPLLWAPLSEIKGRKLPALIAMLGFCLFGVGAATANDTQTLMLCRFFQGLMGSGPIVITPGVIADVFSPFHRGYVMSCFAVTVFMGPMIAPFIAGFTVQNENLGWRWTVWWGFFFGVVATLGLAFVADESFGPVLLSRKASSKRRVTGDWAFHAKHDEQEVDIRLFLQRYMKRPIVMVLTEPILLLISIYTAFVYAILYTFLTSYALVFRLGYGMSAGISGLPFFGLVFGLLLAFAVNIFAQPHLNARIRKNNAVFVPEWLMPLGLSGAIVFPAGLFWFGWTAAYQKHVHWIIPTASGLLTGYGLLMIFMTQFTYLVIVYKQNAASAFGGNTIVRSALAAGFPLFATQLFEQLGIKWANTLLGCIAVLLVPVPVAFYFYGATIRARSRYVP